MLWQLGPIYQCWAGQLDHCRQFTGALEYARKSASCACELKGMNFKMQALEYQMQQGMAEGGQQPVFIMPRSAQHTYEPPLQSACCLIRLLATEL